MRPFDSPRIGTGAARVALPALTEVRERSSRTRAGALRSLLAKPWSSRIRSSALVERASAESLHPRTLFHRSASVLGPTRRLDTRFVSVKLQP